MQISVAYALPEKQIWLELSVPDDSTVMDAITQSKILALFPEVNLENQKVGIFGKFCKLETKLKEGDRVEIYRPITADPLTVPRRDTGDDDESDD
ncbi:MAG: RnfH family protein [Gammaproteobacteria bacterium]|jgi:putative ubiquitin-RnfH superfamily antitoxin RatB of RatAB toxin-antitoxin module